MKKLLLMTAAIVMMAAPAIAQDAPAKAPEVTTAPTPTPATPDALPTPPPMPPQTGKFYLEIEQVDLNVMAAGINELPKKIADPLILKLNAQLNPQVQAKIKAQQQAVAKSLEEKTPPPMMRPRRKP